jgi:methionyl-tRNA formyltransferase
LTASTPSTDLKVAFAGTPVFAAVALEALLAEGYSVPLVLTQPDRPAGRGMKLQASPVKQVALRCGIPLAQPHSLRLDGKYPTEAAQAREQMLGSGADVLVVAAYGLILPQWVLDWPRLGCLNIHASLLPRWRGAAPIHRAIEAGDAQTGITIMQMDIGLDTGGMVQRGSLPVLPSDTTASLHDRLADMGGRMVVDVLGRSTSGRLPAQAQPAEGAVYAHKIEKAEAQLDWTLPAVVLERRIRAFDPFPGAFTEGAGESIKVWQAHVLQDADARLPHADQPPGTVVSSGSEGVCVQTGQGVLCLTSLQRAGGKRLGAAEFLRGLQLPQGARLGAAAPLVG